MSATCDVVVIGSVNIDLVVRAARIPAAGETILGRDLMTFPGGKGANQAVAAARLGARTALVGRVGDDPYGGRLLASLQAAGVNTRHVTVTEGVPSGTALICVDALGENAICVAGGANMRVTPADIDRAAPLIRSAKVCLLQLELPIETVLHALQVCRAAEVETILDPAPCPEEPVAGLFHVAVLSPNQHEAERLTGERFGNHAEVKLLAATLAARGPAAVVVKLGERGAVYFDGEQLEHLPAHRITPVDTTAAGDAFTAALGVARAAGEPLAAATRFANAAGAVTCLKQGAQPALPTRPEVERMMRHP
ncbi:MAG: ribokinase [Phycisphaerae bacterium]